MYTILHLYFEPDLLLLLQELPYFPFSYGCITFLPWELALMLTHFLAL